MTVTAMHSVSHEASPASLQERRLSSVSTRGHLWILFHSVSQISEQTPVSTKEDDHCGGLGGRQPRHRSLLAQREHKITRKRQLLMLGI